MALNFSSVMPSRRERRITAPSPPALAASQRQVFTQIRRTSIKHCMHGSPSTGPWCIVRSIADQHCHHMPAVHLTPLEENTTGSAGLPLPRARHARRSSSGRPPPAPKDALVQGTQNTSVQVAMRHRRQQYITERERPTPPPPPTTPRRDPPPRRRTPRAAHARATASSRRDPPPQSQREPRGVAPPPPSAARASPGGFLRQRRREGRVGDSPAMQMRSLPESP